MPEVPPSFPRLGDDKLPDSGSVVCGCGCGLVGTPRKKPMNDGLIHVHRCKCKRCVGGRVRRTGLAKQGIARKALGINPRFRNHLSNEESWGKALRVESKSQGAAKPVVTRFIDARDQSDANKAIGDNRPFAATFMGQGTFGVFCCDLAQIREVVAALIEVWEETP